MLQLHSLCSRLALTLCSSLSMEPPTPSRTPQSSSFPFLLVTALLFYFFSRSPSLPDTHSREHLSRALTRRQLEIVGLKQWLNSSTSGKIKKNDQIYENIQSNLTEAPITSHLCSLANETFGTQTLSEGQGFVIRWIDELQGRVKSPHLFWRNLTGHVKADWKLNDLSSEWYPHDLLHDQQPLSSSSSSSSNITKKNETEPLAAQNSFNSSFSAQRGKFPWTSSLMNNQSGSKKKSEGRRKVGYNLQESALELVRSNVSLIRVSIQIYPFSQDFAPPSASGKPTENKLYPLIGIYVLLGSWRERCFIGCRRRTVRG